MFHKAKFIGGSVSFALLLVLSVTLCVVFCEMCLLFLIHGIFFFFLVAIILMATQSQPFQVKAEPSTAEHGEQISAQSSVSRAKDKGHCYFKYTCLQQTFQSDLMECIDIFHCWLHLSHYIKNIPKKVVRT